MHAIKEEEGLEKHQMGIVLLVVHPTHQSQEGGRERDPSQLLVRNLF
uniref:Uncharacterized protein n=1 Tax=Arundo donax TaxID=35708 RepID=A0A0A9F5W7_ARUDO